MLAVGLAVHRDAALEAQVEARTQQCADAFLLAPLEG